VAAVIQREVRVPGDKSLSHRALIFSALGEGTSRVRGVLRSHDVESTAAVLRGLGVLVPTLADEIRIPGLGLRGLAAPSRDLDCGNSGTTTRLMAGILAAHPFTSRLVGDASLSRRPMRRIARPLTAMGATVRSEAGEGLPLTITGGTLRGVEWQSDVASAQVKGAVLLAGLVAGVVVSVNEPAQSRDHTERMLAGLGIRIDVAGTRVTLRESHELPALDLRVPGDPSSAAYFIALAAAFPDREIVLPGVCLNPTRIGFVDAVRRMGASVDIEPTGTETGETVGTITARAGDLRGVSVDAAEVPAMIDEIPLLACLAARASGDTVIRGAGELRVKESDRIAAVAANLTALGVRVEETGDGMRVIGTDAPLRGRVHAFADHRIAMAFGVLGALPGNRIQIDDPTCVNISYPQFWADLTRAST
jgi:3-phosphoshikimate 1-carboxyvinyltransferase